MTSGGSQRIAHQGLEHRPAHPQRGPEDYGRRDSGEPPLHHDVAHDPGIPAGQRRQHLTRRELIRADRQTQHRHRHHDDRQCDADDDRAERQRTAIPARRTTTMRCPKFTPARQCPIAHSPLTLLRRTRAISTGAPTNAVTIPTGSSPGIMTMRPRMSEASSRLGARRML